MSIGLRHQKSKDLSFQSEHDYSVAHKTKNKVPFDSTKINVMYEYDKEGNEKKTEFYRMKFKQDYLYVEKFLENGKLTIEDMNFKKNISEEDKKRRFNYLNDLLNKLDKDILKNSLENFKNAPKIAAWYKQQEKNKRQSAKKTHGKSEHKSIQPFMTNVIFFGKEDLKLGNEMDKNDLDNRVKKFIDKFQKKYNIPKESIKLARHEDETSVHFHWTFLNWNEKTKHFNNSEMNTVKDIQGHLDMLEEEFADILQSKRIKYTDSKKQRHKTLVEYNAELVAESKTKSAQLDKISNELDTEKDKLNQTKDTIVKYIDKKKELIDANKKLHSENIEHNIALVENITNNKLSEIELKKKKKQEQELTDKVELAKINIEKQKQQLLFELTKFNEKVHNEKERIITEAKKDIEKQYQQINQDTIDKHDSLKFENEQLAHQIEQQKSELQELTDNKLALTEIQNNKVAVNAHILDKVAKDITDISDVKIIKILNKIEEDHNIKIDILKQSEYRKEAKINTNEIYGTFEKFIKGFKDTLDKLSAVAKKVLHFGLNRSRNQDLER